MRIVIAGGSGFLGQALSTQLMAGGHDVTILSRAAAARDQPGLPRVVLWEPNGTVDVWALALDGADAVVNLAGAGVADKRWSAARKRLLLDSRLAATYTLIAGIQSVAHRPDVFIQGCAVGYYGATMDDRLLDESQPAGGDFLARLCVNWEAAAKPIADLGCRLVTLRTGLVLARHGGALPLMALPFRFFAGGPTGTGRQYFPWIHLDDWIALVAWAIGNPDVDGTLNATAPDTVTNAEFSAALGRALGRPSWLPAPAFALRIIVGAEMADLALLNGQRAIPKRPLALGFAFAYPSIDEALQSILGRHGHHGASRSEPGA